MTIRSLPIADIKNQWLSQHIDVKFPTKESVAGCALYQRSLEARIYQVWQPDPTNDGNAFGLQEIYLVDFHRLTVMFSILQSQQWVDEKEQAEVLEFFTQIILSPPCDLYVAFNDGIPAAAAIVTQTDDSILVSDIVLISNIVVAGEQVNDHLALSFASQLINQMYCADIDTKTIYIEKK
ncbi:flavodoxin [Vibrio sp. YMD68]|uniref:flavodoxin n=1 Tax=Vibrio sp. YMD68 TaxID=3042300 RepID=UPI00249C05EF|nr:flavodoxin [Vibrio sp. YMD68]WGV98222.1 flavodoxin [Vibrio sp. YMD68]